MTSTPTTVALDSKQVSALFASAITQADYILGLMRMVHPDYDAIKVFRGNPICSPDTWKAICREAQVVDERINRTRSILAQLLPGGGWMNYGFSARGGEDLPRWEVIPVAEENLERNAPALLGCTTPDARLAAAVSADIAA